jgi:GT2 family glycosyltransferase
MNDGAGTGAREPRPETIPVGARVRIAAVVPCFNRQDDLDRLLADFARLDLDGIDLDTIVVDNASDPALTLPDAPGAQRRLRLERNRGGSGGFNAGLALALADEPEAVWLVDSDARVEARTLCTLVEAMREDPTLVVAGSIVTDPHTGQPFEAGGRVNRRNGVLEPIDPGSPEVPDYVASCSALVRAEAIRRTGLMPDTFLNADDVLWCLRLAGWQDHEGTSRSVSEHRAHPPDSGAIGVIAGSIARHPRFDRAKTWARYYASRNAFGPLGALRLGPAVRLRRALIETSRAIGQRMIGADDLAHLHVLGLAHAAQGRTIGPGPTEVRLAGRLHATDRLEEHLREAGVRPCRAVLVADALDEPTRTDITARLHTLGFEIEEKTAGAGVLARLFSPARHPVAIVSAKGRPSAWFRAPVTIRATSGTFALTRTARLPTLCAAAATALRCLPSVVRLTLRPPPPATCPEPLAPLPGTPALSIVILSYNRFDALEKTLTNLSSDPGATDAQIIVVDNASTDGTVTRLPERFPGVHLVALGENIGVAAFNRGVAIATGDLALILDDDAWPHEDALASARALMRDRPDLAAVTLVPRHPDDNTSEWPFAREPRDDWPFMGCANLVRREAWLDVGGYEEGFFLYRNDTDMALKLLASGRGVHCNPEWCAWHESPAAMRKSDRWFRYATRNWIWMTRRHGRGMTRLAGVAAGWGWAHRLAGARAGSHVATLRGALAGLLRPPPPLPANLRTDGAALDRLLSARLDRRA